MISRLRPNRPDGPCGGVQDVQGVFHPDALGKGTPRGGICVMGMKVGNTLHILHTDRGRNA